MEENIRGLTKREVNKSRKKHGNNNIEIEIAPDFMVRFIQAFFSISQLLLLLSVFLICLVVYYKQTSYQEALIILGIYSLIGIVRLIYSSRTNIDYSKLMENNTRVVRDDRLTSVYSDELVVGDIIQVNQNDTILADGMILQCRDLVVNESIYNSKNRRVIKKQQDNVYVGSYVLFGTALIKVTAVGNETVLGSCEPTYSKRLPYEKKITTLVNIIMVLASIIATGILAYHLYKIDGIHLSTCLDYIPVMVPFYTVVGISGSLLSNSYFLGKIEKFLSKKNMQLYSEGVLNDLADIDLVVLDKQDSFTKDQKAIVQSFADDQDLIALGLGLYSKDHRNDYSEAFRDFAVEKHFDIDALKSTMPLINSSANSSLDHIVSNLYKSEKGYILYSIGPVEDLLDISTRIYMDGDDVFFGAKEREIIGKHTQLMKRQGQQVLGIAYCIYRNEIANVNYVNDICFIGLIGLMYPLKDGVSEGIAKLQEHDIRVMMISNERSDIVAVAAKKANIIHNDDEILTGPMLENMTERRLQADLGDYKVFVNLNAAQKERLIVALKEYYGCNIATVAKSVSDFRTIRSASILLGGKANTSEFISSFSSVLLEDLNLDTIAISIQDAKELLERYTKMSLAMITLFFTTTIIALMNCFFNIYAMPYGFNLPVLYLGAFYIACFILINTIGKYNTKKTIEHDFNKLILTGIIHSIFNVFVLYCCNYTKYYFEFDKSIPNILYGAIILMAFFASYLYENRKSNSYTFHFGLVLARIILLACLGFIYYYHMQTIIISKMIKEIAILAIIPILTLVLGMIAKRIIFRKG